MKYTLPLNKLFALQIMLLFGGITLAQDPLFTQFYAAPTYLSPAFAGTSVQSRFAANYRNQWPGIPKPITSYCAAYDQYVPEYSSGFGVIASHFRAGDGLLRSTSLSVQYAYEARLKDSFFFRPALQFGFANRNVNFNDLVFGDQLVRGGDVATIEQATQAVNYFDVGTGGLFFGKKGWLGGSVHHINQPKESLYGDFAFVPRKYGVHGGYRFRFKPNPFKRSRNFIVAAFNYQAQAEFDQLDAGFYYELTPFTLGFWYRGLPTKKNNEGKPNHDAVAIILGYYAGPYRIGYSYDITISSLSVVNTTGAHEISIVYEWANKRNAKLAKRRVVPCAKF